MDTDEIITTLHNWSLRFAESDTLSQVPEEWRPIARSEDPQGRCRQALDLWNDDFLDLLPRFAATLRTRLVDVRAAFTDGCPVLVYALRADNGAAVSWIGYHPGAFEEPRFWESFPQPLQDFLRTVHAGFVSGSRTSFGVAPPVHMETLAELADFPDGIPGWTDTAGISSTRLLRISSDGGILYYCASPDIERGKIALVYEGDIDPQDLGQELDELVTSRLRTGS
ncbi:hypothetical protein ACFW2Y_09080 [Streptomyces sp. NPDC058877]|uniref:hypothetical protein n=1 Tax=unclassified Streptomyces TaxID=2593676 RepID=UPI003676BCE9